MIPNYLFFGYRAILPMAGIVMIVAYGLAVVFAWAAENPQTRVFRPALSTALVFSLICLAAVSFGQARKWSPLNFWKTPADRLPPYSEELERVAYLDIAVNCTLEFDNASKFAEAIDLYGKACGIPPESEKALSKITEEPERGAAYKAATEKMLKNFADKPDRTSGVLMNLGVVLADDRQFAGSHKPVPEGYRDMAILRDAFRQPGGFAGISGQALGGHAGVREGYHG